MTNELTTTEQIQNAEIVEFQINEEESIPVRKTKRDVWLTQKQMAYMLKTTVPNVSMHIKKFIEANELDRNSVVKKILITANDGKQYNVDVYNLKTIIYVCFRINSETGKRFRAWASEILEDKLNQGYENFQQEKVLRQDTRTSMTAQKYPAKKIERVDLIKSLLLQKGITQKDIARELNIHYVTVHNALYGINFCLAVENWLKENLFAEKEDKKSAYSEKILEKWEEAQNGSSAANETLMQMLKGFSAMYAA